MRKLKKQNAITLVALVVTIVILLILAGISISALTNTGIFAKANEAKIKNKEAQDKELIQLTMYSNDINRYTEKAENQIGEQLYDKNVENGTKWHIIVMSDSSKIYGTGYIYLAKGTEIEGKKLENDWIIEQNDSNLIKLEPNTFTDLSYKTVVGVTDGLIFNLDPSIIENANKDNINEQLGENVELVNFDWNNNSGLTKKSFNFDGVNDYIKIKYDNQQEKDTLAKNGFTFEFYGIFNGGSSYKPNNELITDNMANYKGLFCYWNGIEQEQADLRFGIAHYGKEIYWNAGWYPKNQSDFVNESTKWNIIYPEIEDIKENKEVYFSIAVDCSQEQYKQTVYANGRKVYEGNFDCNYWKSFVDSCLGKLNYFCVGRSSMSGAGWWHYSKMNAYSLKLYNRGLSEKEIKENYNKAVAYHNTL